MTTDYNPIARQYKQSKFQPWRRYVETFTLMNLIGVPTGKTVVDLACGEGFYSLKVKEKGAVKVLGVDLSEGMPVTWTFFVEGGAFDIENYFLDADAHEEAPRTAGFREIRWHNPSLSPEGIAAHGKDYWKRFVDHPPIVAIECIK